MEPTDIAAAWKLLRATDNSFISPLDVAQLRDFLREALRTIEVHPAEVEKVRRDALGEACKDVCYYCKIGPQAELRIDGFYPAAYEHHIDMSSLKSGKFIWQPCVANAIHQRLAASNPAPAADGVVGGD